MKGSDFMVNKSKNNIVNKVLNDKYNDSTFESIKHLDDYGNEYWYARELQKALDYKDWRNFEKVIDKAIISANNSISNKDDWVVEVNKPIKTGKGKEENIKDYKLSRYICYLIVQNADPSKEVVALGQTYFAIQTRKQEITEQEYEALSDDEKRFYQRKLTRQGIIRFKKSLHLLVLKIWQNFIMQVIEDYIMVKQLMIFLKERNYVIEKIY